MRDGLPCFSYPQDEQIKKSHIRLAILSVSKRGPVGTEGWEMQIARSDRKGLLEPNSPETCIRYGGSHPGTKDKRHAEPLQMDTPYEVHISVATTSGPFSVRYYSSNFCITCDEKGNKVIVAADTEPESKVITWKCLKSGEKPKRSFWERLFGK
ncbi:MAG: hypothetical protein ABFD76_17305 [Smithella sp.]